MIKTFVKKSHIHNFGIFAGQDIPVGTRIIEYTGELIDKKEEARREKQNEKIGITYIFDVNDRYSIDAAIGGNNSKYINHSCDPNCDAERFKNRVFLYSNKFIPKGNELTVDYAFDSKEPL